MAALEQLLAERRALLDRVAALNLALARLGHVSGRADAVVEALADGATNARGVAKRTGLSVAYAAGLLSRLATTGRVVRVRWGVYALPGSVVQKGDDHAA